MRIVNEINVNVNEELQLKSNHDEVIDRLIALQRYYKRFDDSIKIKFRKSKIMNVDKKTYLTKLSFKVRKNILKCLDKQIKIFYFTNDQDFAFFKIEQQLSFAQITHIERAQILIDVIHENMNMQKTNDETKKIDQSSSTQKDFWDLQTTLNKIDAIAINLNIACTRINYSRH